MTVKSPSPKVQERQDIVVAALARGESIDTATARAGRTPDSYRGWRRNYPEFARKADRAINSYKGVKRAPVPFDAAFQKRYLHRDTPEHQGRIIDLLTSLDAGEWGLCLIPPDHLKTSTVEDYLTHRIAMDPNVRALVISKTEGHAKKVVGTVRDRLEAFDAYEDLITDYGPFMGRPWTQSRFNVAAKDSGERDHTIEAVGIAGPDLRPPR